MITFCRYEAYPSAAWSVRTTKVSVLLTISNVNSCRKAERTFVAKKKTSDRKKDNFLKSDNTIHEWANLVSHLAILGDVVYTRRKKIELVLKDKPIKKVAKIIALSRLDRPTN